MAKVRVKFYVSPKTACENLFIVGSTSSLGYWNPKKATQLKFNEETNSFYCMKYLPVDETVEFKFITIKDWNGVEKGIWNEEINNRVIVPTKGLELNLTIETFRNN